MIKPLLCTIDKNRKDLRVYPSAVGLVISILIIAVVAIFTHNHFRDNPAHLHSENGSSLIRQGLHLDAIKEFNKAIKLSPNLAEPYLHRGYAYSLLGEYQKAIENYDISINLNPTIALAYDSRGAALHNIGEILLAIDDYDRALELDPTLSKVYLNRSIAYSQLGEHEKSIADKTKACAQNEEFC